MNKMIKGSVAGATGIALLMGGFGTYALWSDSEQLEAETLTTGELDVDPGAVTWDDQATAGTGDWSSSDLLVPGDEVKRTQSFFFTGTGKNLTGTIRFNPGAESATGDAGDFLDIDVAVSGLTGVTGTGGCYEFTAPLGSMTVGTTVTYTFSDQADEQDSQSATTTLADSTFVIEQGDVCA
ncbi:MAG TPA: alternate-type signal peptide domain-containing protein [Nocardioides sp.]|nr:alternate-type signal peptide domain-containing protein [Nocardioides sp.]